MAGDEMRMPLDAVRTHATNVDNISADVATAHDAANQMHLDNEAFGQLCSFLPGLLEPIFSTAVNALKESSSGLAQTADNLRQAANNAQTTDQQSSAYVDGTHRNVNIPL